MSAQPYDKRVIADFIAVKRFCLWLHDEVKIGIKLLENDTDIKLVMLNCQILIASPRPVHVADLLHNIIWPACGKVIELRVMEMCGRAATVACYFDSEEAEIHHGPIQRYL